MLYTVRYVYHCVFNMQSRVPILYKVKVMNPIRPRKKATTRQLHDFTGKFSSVLQVKQQIIKELSDILPPSQSPDLIEVGYFEGRQSTKIVIVSSKDLDAMYEKLTIKKSSEVFLWAENLPDDYWDDCDEERESAATVKKKRKNTEVSTNKQEEIDDILRRIAFTA